jgi:hypothetical protein
MLERPNKGLFRFVEFNKRLSQESRLATAFDSLYYASERMEDAIEGLEDVVNEILYGPPQVNCS